MVGLFKKPKRHLKKLLKEGEYDEAVAFGKNLESEYSDDPDFMFIMGSVYFIVDDAQKALPYFEKAFQLNNNDVELLTLKQQKDEAIDCCVRIIELQPKNSEAKKLLDELESL
jgi:tetratricopeptide (TPR) repeat protein